MKRILVISIIFGAINITANNNPTILLKKYMPDKNINLVCSTLCATVSIWELYKVQKFIPLRIKAPFALHISAAQVALGFVATAFSYSWLKKTEIKKDPFALFLKDDLDQNLILNTIEAVFN